MKNNLLLTLVTCLLVIPSAPWAIDSNEDKTQKQKAQDLKGSLSVGSRTKINSIADNELRVAFIKNGIPSIGLLEYSKDGLMWAPEQTKKIKMPYKLDAMVAANGRVLLQYGDSTYHQHPAKTDLFFFDENGVEKGQVLDRYGPQTNIVMDEEGYVAVAGELFKDKTRTEIGLYTNTGEKLFQVKLAEGRRANIAVPASQGKQVAVFTTDSKDYLADHRLEIFDKNGEKTAEKRGLGILQKVVAVANGSMFFVQSKNSFSLVIAEDGSILWSRNKVLRLISPHGVTTDPQGKTLFLAAAEWDGIPKSRYQWRIEVRDVATGDELARFILPETYPSNAGRVFLNVTNKQIELLAGDERIVLDWSRP